MPLMKLNPYLNYKLTLYREVNKKIRYYSFYLCSTLFGEYLLIREFGGMSNKKPTGILKEYFLQIEDSIKVMDTLINEKIKKGYLKINI